MARKKIRLRKVQSLHEVREGISAQKRPKSEGLQDLPAPSRSVSLSYVTSAPSSTSAREELSECFYQLYRIIKNHFCAKYPFS